MTRTQTAPVDQVVETLLARHGRTFASEAGIRLDRDTPAPLFQLLCLSLLFSARISADIAMAASRALIDAGWTTPQKMAEATWEDRTQVLNRSGYARYDESTSRYLAATAKLLIDRWDGDLRRLHDEAGGDLDELRRLLTEFKGIGQVGAAIFIREVQGLWEDCCPFVDDRTLEVAADLGLPRSAQELRDATPDAPTFARLVSALMRTRLAGDTDEILAEAAGRS